MNIIEVAENKDKLLQENLVEKCPKCGLLNYSVFDRLFILVNDECFDCLDKVNVERAGEAADRVLAIL